MNADSMINLDRDKVFDMAVKAKGRIKAAHSRTRENWLKHYEDRDNAWNRSWFSFFFGKKVFDRDAVLADFASREFHNRPESIYAWEYNRLNTLTDMCRCGEEFLITVDDYKLLTCEFN